jgi:hypothetical protein
MLVELYVDELITTISFGTPSLRYHLEHLPFKLVKRGAHSDWTPDFNYFGGHQCQWKAVNVDTCRTHNTSARILTCQHLPWYETSVCHIWKTHDSHTYLTGQRLHLWGKQYADCATILIVRHNLSRTFLCRKNKTVSKVTQQAML